MDTSRIISRSPYKRGADRGAWFGIYLTALFFATSYSVDRPLCAVVGMALMLGVPPCIFFMLRRSYVADGGDTQFSSLWMEGIAIFFFGGLIASIVALVYMRWIEPTFFEERVDTLISIYSAMDLPQAKEASEMLQAARDQKLLPKPIEITVDMLWLIVFTGSLLSMVMTWLIKMLTPRRSITRHSNNLSQKT